MPRHGRAARRRDYRAYEKRSGNRFPEEWKAPALLKLMPKSHLADMRWKFAAGLTNYNALVESVTQYSQHLRFEGSFQRGDNDMQCDLLEHESLQRAREGSSFIQFGLPGLTPDLPVDAVAPSEPAANEDFWEHWARTATPEQRLAVSEGFAL